MSRHLPYAGIPPTTLINEGGFDVDRSHCEACAGAIGLARAEGWHLSHTGDLHVAVLFIGTVDDIESAVIRIGEFIAQSSLVPSPEEYWMSLAVAASRRSRSNRRQVGAVLIANSDVISIGVNEVPGSRGGLAWPGEDEWSSDVHERLDRASHIRTWLATALGDHEVGQVASARIIDDYERYLRPLVDIDRAVHAEIAAVLSCARRGVPVDGSELFTNLEPCYRCMRACLAAGVARMTFLAPREDISDPVLRSRLRAPIDVRAFTGLATWNVSDELR